ncbi:MAG: zinc-dependent metalloprotease [Actinomycetota bacterium]
MARLVEPAIASAVARRVAGTSGLDHSYLLDRLRADLGEAVPQAEKLVAEASGIPAPPPVEWGLIDRATWAEANISSMTALLNPIADKIGDRLERLPLAAKTAQRAVVSVEVGVLLGYVSRRVLGQYDLLVPEDDGSPEARRRRKALPAGGAALYFVGPNLIETERRHGFVPRDFAMWVALHEVTHRFQFEGVPWLRSHFLDLVKRYVDRVDIDAKGLAKRLRVAARRLASKGVPPEERSPMYLLATEEQRVVLDEIQALMAVVEGHGNYVMDSVGESVIPSMRRMRFVFEKRREQVNLVQRVISSTLGLEMKLKQYELGQAFCEAAVRAAGPEVLARLWDGPEQFPTLAELKSPELWLGRVAA